MYSVLLAEIVTQNNLTVLSASLILRRPQNYALAFLSLGKPLIFIVLPDIIYDSFQLNLAIFLYFYAPPVSSTKRLIFKGQ